MPVVYSVLFCHDSSVDIRRPLWLDVTCYLWLALSGFLGVCNVERAGVNTRVFLETGDCVVLFTQFSLS